MATAIVYGPITLTNVIIRGIERVDVPGDDPGQVLYSKYTISFAGHCNSVSNAHRRRDTLINQGADRVSSNFPAWTAQTLFHYMSLPRQYFRLDFSGSNILEYPMAHQTMDSNFGPTPKGIKVSSIAGDLGVDGGGYFLVSGAIEVCIDFGTPVGSTGNEPRHLQGYSLTREHDVNGDNFLTTIYTTIHIYGRPEVIRSIEAGGSQSVWAYFGDLAQLLGVVPPGFKRRNAKVRINPGGTHAIVLLVDDELNVPLGGASPASAFSPQQTDRNVIGGGEKEGAPQSIRIVTINAVCPKNETRERVIGMMIYWLTVKTMGGSGKGALDRSPRFVYYREITLHVDYATGGLTMTAVCQLHWPKAGPYEIPYSVRESRLGAVQDYGDVDYALSWFRANPDEPLQGTQRGAAISPGLNYHGTAGSYLAEVYADRIKHGYANAMKNPVDGNNLACLQSYFGDPGYDGGPGIAPPNTYFEVPVTITDDLEEASLVWKQESSMAYESTWMQTKYHTDSGRAVLPTGGVIPSETYTEDETPADRVEITIHKGRTIKVVTWGVQCVGEGKPEYPNKQTYNLNDIYIGQRIQPAAVVPLGLGINAWTVTGTYWYDCLDLRGAGDSLSVGKLPITNGEASDYALPGGSAVTGYLPT